MKVFKEIIKSLHVYGKCPPPPGHGNRLHELGKSASAHWESIPGHDKSIPVQHKNPP
jgi:hypothetical protein